MNSARKRFEVSSDGASSLEASSSSELLILVDCTEGCSVDWVGDTVLETEGAGVAGVSVWFWSTSVFQWSFGGMTCERMTLGAGAVDGTAFFFAEGAVKKFLRNEELFCTLSLFLIVPPRLTQFSLPTCVLRIFFGPPVPSG